jgi:PIN domain
MISSAEVARRIIVAPAPVLLIDTCALLDLMRDPRRDTFSSDQVRAAHRLLGKVEERPRSLWLPIVRQVLLELDDNKQPVKIEAENAIKNLQETIERVQGLFAAHGIVTSAISPKLADSQFPETTATVVEKFVSSALHITTPRGAERSAFSRIAQNIAPSKKGKQAKDCLVFESYLMVAAHLREGGFGGSIVFLTTNKNDYSHMPNAAVPHPDLANDLAALNISYAANLLMAERLLGI